VICFVACIERTIWDGVSRNGTAATITQINCVLAGHKMMTCINIKKEIEIVFKQDLLEEFAISYMKICAFFTYAIMPVMSKSTN